MNENTARIIQLHNNTPSFVEPIGVQATMKLLQEHIPSATLNERLIKDIHDLARTSLRIGLDLHGKPPFVAEEWHTLQRVADHFGSEIWDKVFNTSSGWPYIEVAISRLLR